MPVSGKVERGDRTVERECDRVPGVRVLGAAVQEHELGRTPAPHERGDRLIDADGDLDAADVGRTSPRDAELVGVLAEQAELVVRVGHDNGSLLLRPRSDAVDLRARAPCNYAGCRVGCRDPNCVSDASYTALDVPSPAVAYGVSSADGRERGAARGDHRERRDRAALEL